MSKTVYEPMNGLVVVKPHPKTEEKTKGGIILTEASKNPHVWGTVFLAAKECYVEKGWEVMSLENTAGEITIDNEQYLLMNEDSILMAKH